MLDKRIHEDMRNESVEILHSRCKIGGKKFEVKIEVKNYKCEFTCTRKEKS